MRDFAKSPAAAGGRSPGRGRREQARAILIGAALGFFVGRRRGSS